MRSTLDLLEPAERRRVPLLAAFGLSAAILETLLLFLVGRLATALTAAHATIPVDLGPVHVPDVSAGTMVATCAVLLLAHTALALPAGALAARLSESALTTTRVRLLHAYLSSTWAYRSRAAEGHLQHLLGEYSQNVERLLAQLTVIIVASASISMLALGAVLTSPVIAALAFLGLLAIAMLFRPFNRYIRRQSTTYAAANVEIARDVAQTARLSQEIAAFEVAAPIEDGLADRISSNSKTLRRFRFTNGVTPVLYQNAALALIVGIIAALDVIRPEELTATGPVLLLLVRALGYGRQLQYASQVANELSPYLSTIHAEAVALADHEVGSGGAATGDVSRIELRSLGFRYGEGELVLRDVNTTLERGAFVGVIGPSGAGKSTLVQLLLGLQAPTEGEILVDDVSLRDIAPAAWAKTIAFVPQDNKLEHASILENIRFHRAALSDADVRRAARDAHLLDEILALPDGFGTVVGPGAIDLSGGQRQRLGIARALVGCPQVLVLDEPTSALDSRSELLIRDTLECLRGTATVIVVAHRPATLDICEMRWRVGGGGITVERRAPSRAGAEVPAR
jgi:ABC-type multidrug transport system fused ATPase/permease subunit